MGCNMEGCYMGDDKVSSCLSGGLHVGDELARQHGGVQRVPLLIQYVQLALLGLAAQPRRAVRGGPRAAGPSPLCYLLTTLLPLCYHSVTPLLPLCYHSVTTLLPLCYHSVTTLLRNGDI